MAKEKLLSMTDYAKLKDVKLKDIKQAIKENIISKAVKIGRNDRKLISVKIADPLWNMHKFGVATEPPKNSDFEKHSPGQGHREGSMMVDKDNFSLYSKARSSREAYAAKIAQVKYEEMIGSLVKKEDIVSAAKDIGRNLREALLNLPNKLAPIVAAEDDINTINKILKDEIESALENLSRGDYEFLSEE